MKLNKKIASLISSVIFISSINLEVYAKEVNSKGNNNPKAAISIDLDTKNIRTFNLNSNESSIISINSSKHSYEGTGIINQKNLTQDNSLNDDVDNDNVVFEGNLSRAILGSDNRSRITTTTTFPHRAIVYIEMKCPKNETHVGSGFMISKDTVATAGHCVYSHACGGWMTSIRVYPGRNGSSSPYGSTTAKTLSSVNGWTKNQDRSYDYGVIKLNSSIGNTVGWFGLHGTDSSITGKQVTISGYPAEKSKQQWKHSGKISSQLNSRRILYPIDTTGGQSGSPVYWYDSTYGYQAVGIHTASNSSTSNNGTKITKGVFDYLTSHK